jgi:hypothetical protein
MFQKKIRIATKYTVANMAAIKAKGAANENSGG